MSPFKNHYIPKHLQIKPLSIYIEEGQLDRWETSYNNEGQCTITQNMEGTNNKNEIEARTWGDIIFKIVKREERT